MEETYYRHHTYSNSKFQSLIGDQIAPTFNGFRAAQIEKKLEELIQLRGSAWLIKSNALGQLYSQSGRSQILSEKEIQQFLTSLIVAYFDEMNLSADSFEQKIINNLNKVDLSTAF